MRGKTSNIIAELRSGERLGISVTQLKINMAQIIIFVFDHNREVYITRHGVVIAKLIPCKKP